MSQPLERVSSCGSYADGWPLQVAVTNDKTKTHNNIIVTRSVSIALTDSLVCDTDSPRDLVVRESAELVQVQAAEYE